MENLDKAFVRLFTTADMLILMKQKLATGPITTQERKNIRKRFITRLKSPFQVERFKMYLEKKCKREEPNDVVRCLEQKLNQKEECVGNSMDLQPVSDMVTIAKNNAGENNAGDVDCYLQVYPIETMKRLLCKWVPSGSELSIPHLESENWLREEDNNLIRTNFKERFAHLTVEDLEKLRYDICSSPPGMLTIERLRRSVDNDLKDKIAELQLKRKSWLARQKTARLAETFEKMDIFKEVMPIIKDISHRLGRRASAHAHDGTSTYAEPTLMGLLDIAKELRPLLGDPAGHILMDCGSGVGTAIWTLCQALRTRGIGIEYSDNRMFSGSKASYELLSCWKGNTTLQHQVVLLHHNLLNLRQIPSGVTVAYQFDEVFPPQLMDHMMVLYANAPPSLRFIICSKAYKYRSYIREFQSWGLYPLTNPILCNKIGSGESSGFIIYGRQCCDYSDLGNKVFPPPDHLNGAAKKHTSENETHLISPDTLALFNILQFDVDQMTCYYKKLAETMDEIISVRRA